VREGGEGRRRGGGEQKGEYRGAKRERSEVEKTGEMCK